MQPSHEQPRFVAGGRVARRREGPSSYHRQHLAQGRGLHEDTHGSIGGRHTQVWAWYNHHLYLPLEQRVRVKASRCLSPLSCELRRRQCPQKHGTWRLRPPEEVTGLVGCQQRARGSGTGGVGQVLGTIAFVAALRARHTCVAAVLIHTDGAVFSGKHGAANIQRARSHEQRATVAAVAGGIQLVRVAADKHGFEPSPGGCCGGGVWSRRVNTGGCGASTPNNALEHLRELHKDGTGALHGTGMEERQLVGPPGWGSRAGRLALGGHWWFVNHYLRPQGAKPSANGCAEGQCSWAPAVNTSQHPRSVPEFPPTVSLQRRSNAVTAGGQLARHQRHVLGKVGDVLAHAVKLRARIRAAHQVRVT